MAPSIESWESINGAEVYTRRWQGTNSICLVFLHGFMEHISRTGYLNWFDRLNNSGYSIVAYDQQGFGRTAAKTHTAGKSSYAKALKDLDAIILKEAAKKPKKLFLYAHSMGGAISLIYATSGKEFTGLAHLDGIIVSAPLIDQAAGVKAPALQVTLGSLASRILPNTTISVGVPSNDICRDDEVNKDYAEDPLCPPTGSLRLLSDMLTMGPALLSSGYRNFPKSLPVLIYMGTADKVTSFDDAQAFANKLEADDKTFIPYEGYYHELHNEPGQEKWRVLTDVTAWLDKHSQ